MAVNGASKEDGVVQKEQHHLFAASGPLKIFASVPRGGMVFPGETLTGYVEFTASAQGTISGAELQLRTLQRSFRWLGSKSSNIHVRSCEELCCPDNKESTAVGASKLPLSGSRDFAAGERVVWPFNFAVPPDAPPSAVVKEGMTTCDLWRYCLWCSLVPCGCCCPSVVVDDFVGQLLGQPVGLMHPAQASRRHWEGRVESSLGVEVRVSPPGCCGDGVRAAAAPLRVGGKHVDTAPWAQGRTVTLAVPFNTCTPAFACCGTKGDLSAEVFVPDRTLVLASSRCPEPQSRLRVHLKAETRRVALKSCGVALVGYYTAIVDGQRFSNKRVVGAAVRSGSQPGAPLLRGDAGADAPLEFAIVEVPLRHGDLLQWLLPGRLFERTLPPTFSSALVEVQYVLVFEVHSHTCPCTPAAQAHMGVFVTSNPAPSGSSGSGKAGTAYEPPLPLYLNAVFTENSSNVSFWKRGGAPHNTAHQPTQRGLTKAPHALPPFTGVCCRGSGFGGGIGGAAFGVRGQAAVPPGSRLEE